MKKEVFYPLTQEGNTQLICFPYLGGHLNSFSNLANNLKNVEVWSAIPPGHGGSSAPLLKNLDSLVNVYYREMKDIIEPNCILFGHSMGAIVAYFLLQKILQSTHPGNKPKAIILSACTTPAHFEGKYHSAMPDQELIAHLHAYGGIPDEVFKEKSLIEYFLPVYRADFMILEQASRNSFEPLDIPAYYLWGECDQIVSFDEPIRWTRYFTKVIQLIPIKNAPHMFIDSNIETVTEKIQWIIQHVAEINTPTKEEIF